MWKLKIWQDMHIIQKYEVISEEAAIRIKNICFKGIETGSGEQEGMKLLTLQYYFTFQTTYKLI